MNQFEGILARSGSFWRHIGSFWYVLDRSGTFWVVQCFTTTLFSGPSASRIGAKIVRIADLINCSRFCVGN